MPSRSICLDFGTTNSVVALGRDDVSELVEFEGPGAIEAVFRSALCF